MIRKSKEIGSYFELNPSDICSTVYMKKDFNSLGEEIYISTCRSAIGMALRDINPSLKIALLPGFTCHAVVQPFADMGYEVIPYFINDKLEIDFEDLNSKVNKYKPSVILFHDYFGFDSNVKMRINGLSEKLKERGIKIINDQTQSMFSTYDIIEGNYYVGSIRKWMGIPDGAYIKGAKINSLYDTDNELEIAKIEAMTYKYKYLLDNEGTKEMVLKNFKNAESILDSREEPYSISNTSKVLLEQYNIDTMKKTRQKNGQTLLKMINGVTNLDVPFKEVGKKEVPFYIPILVKQKRKELQRYLADNNIFATVIWGCPEEYKNELSVETQNIYEQILCIPCDQRYSVEDMEYIGSLISKFDWEK